MLHRLEIGNGFAKLDALFHVLDRVVEGALREAEHLGTDPDTPFVQGLDGDFVAFARFAESSSVRNRTVLEEQLTGATRPDPQLVFLPADGESRCSAVNHKRS